MLVALPDLQMRRATIFDIAIGVTNALSSRKGDISGDELFEVSFESMGDKPPVLRIRDSAKQVVFESPLT